VYLVAICYILGSVENSDFCGITATCRQKNSFHSKFLGLTPDPYWGSLYREKRNQTKFVTKIAILLKSGDIFYIKTSHFCPLRRRLLHSQGLSIDRFWQSWHFSDFIQTCCGIRRVIDEKINEKGQKILGPTLQISGRRKQIQILELFLRNTFFDNLG
jgi:hypothetical protein